MRSRPWQRYAVLWIGLFTGLWSGAAGSQVQQAPDTPAAPSYTIAALQQQALKTSPILQSSRYLVDAAAGRQQSAGAYPNPSIDFLSGSFRPRLNDGTPTGQSREITLSQPIEWPDARNARINAASVRVDASRYSLAVMANDVLSDVRLRALEWLIRVEEIKSQEDALSLLDQTRQRVLVRVQTGEAPKYELIKADAEVLGARARLEGARAQAESVRLRLAQLIGIPLDKSFRVQSPGRMTPDLARLEGLLATLPISNPEIAQRQSELKASQFALDEQKALRKPAVHLQVKSEQDPSLRLNQLGMVVVIPVFDQRTGLVREAQADLNRQQALLEGRRFELYQQAASAFASLQAAQRQVDAIEGGVLLQAQAALNVAEAAYRFGERGILDTLDAQRVLRTVRSDLLQARLTALSAAADIDRLAGTYMSMLTDALSTRSEAQPYNEGFPE